MTRTARSSDVERELENVRRELEPIRPELAERLQRVIEKVGETPTKVAAYVSTGEAATRLGVSPNTVKKWVRLGVIRKVWTLPGSGYLRIAVSEVERILSERVARIREPGQ